MKIKSEGIETPTTTLNDFSATDDLRRANENLSRQLAKAKNQLADLKQLEIQNARLQDQIDLLVKLDNIMVQPPKWTQPKIIKSARYQGIPSLLLSDCHWDEIVELEEVEGVNKYNREIAILRLKKVLSGTIEVARKFFSGLNYEGFTLMLGGDHFSGNIHEELMQTNEDTIFGSLDFWSDHLCSFIGSIVEEFGHLHIVGVAGNHGRLTHKPRAKTRVRDNLDWLLFRIVAKYFAKDSRITFQVPESADTTIKLYNTSYRLTHGDQFRGGSGISGIVTPLLLGHHRKTQRQMILHNPYDWLVMGHFHEYWMGKGVICNGSTKGYDEFAYVNNLMPQRPIQAFWITTPENNGPTFCAPIFADDRKREGW